MDLIFIIVKKNELMVKGLAPVSKKPQSAKGLKPISTK